ncbi:MAG: nSTAND1 domain-containing NTPase, partial [Planctomycetota bacterium]
NTLTHAVTELRNALGDDARNPSFIETIHRRGYRLIAPVEPAVPDGAAISKVARFPVPERAEERSPYPGLAAFTEADAEFFFGREDEVAKMWRKLTSRRLLAVIGPSGVGKSSFLRAGVIPARPEGWGVLVCQPGEAPFAALARALVPEFAGDIEATAQLVDIRDGDRAVAMVSRWRDRYGQALLILDQFEELFTLNPPETQERFATTLRRLVDDADVHVLLSLRDDFLHRCHKQRPLVPVFEDLTPVGQPDTEALVRALIEPARRLGFEFEDADLPREMASEVEGERSALPLLAFAVARLWDERETESRTLTQDAYDEIGGVGGALGQHAEATLKAVGDERMPIVREIFRNLVTAEGTRAVREWSELLSVFPGSRRTDADTVLRRLVDSRLLTSFEEEEIEGDGRRRVEVVHESLLTSWPRLVRWQTQDADAAQLRDELRQAARTWDDHDRTNDLLWTGSTYREFELWRERYPGGLTEIEEAFAAAMSHHAKRRKRRRRILAASVLAIVVAVAVVFGTLWRRSVQETRRAEAAKLLALAEVQIDEGPTEALAYATASLELSDTHEARRFAVRALAAGPPLRILALEPYSDAQFAVPAFSPDGQWLALAGLVTEDVLVFSENGGQPIVLGGHAVSAANPIQCAWTGDGLLVTAHQTEQRVRLWSIPEGRVVRTIEFEGPAYWVGGERHLLAEVGPGAYGQPGPTQLLRWRLPDGEAEHLGWFDMGTLGFRTSGFDPNGKFWVYSKGDRVCSRPLPETPGTADAVIARHSSDGASVGKWPRPQGFFSSASGGEIILWEGPDGASAPGRHLRKLETESNQLQPDATGSWALERLTEGAGLQLWSIGGLMGARPLTLLRSSPWYMAGTDFHPDRSW